MLRNVASAQDLGMDFGATLTEVEVEWLIKFEFARTADDIIWRRSKLGLKMSSEQVEKLELWMKKRMAAEAAA
jgi:glycerol-3-phosphate dehydrogenase